MIRVFFILIHREILSCFLSLFQRDLFPTIIFELYLNTFILGMCDDGSDRLLIIDDNDTANCSGDVLEETAKSGNKSFSGANDLHKR